MKRFLGTLFLAVFFVLGNITGFSIMASLSYGDAPITGTLTLSQIIECGYWEDTSEEVSFTLKVGEKVGNESRGYFTFFFAAEESTNVYATVRASDNCEECYVNTYCTNGYGAEWNLGSQSGCYVTTTSSGVNEIQLFFKMSPAYERWYYGGYCPVCYDPPVNIKYRIYDVYNSYDEEFTLAEGLEKDVSFLSAAPNGDMVQYKFLGEKGDSVVVETTITNYGNIAEEKWEKPEIQLKSIIYNVDGIVSSAEQVASSSNGILTATLSDSGDYYITVYTPSYSGYPSRTADGCNSVSGSVPVQITITSTTNDLVVNTTGDEPDADLTDGVCDVDLSTDGNQCTLRAAIQEANKREGEDTITFESSVSAISPQKPLPDITETVTIDASSQSSNVELNGSNAGKNADGFSIKKGNLTIKNLTISGFSENGVKSDGYVQLSTVEVTDNKAYGVFAKNDIVISGTETTVSKFNENGKIGLYSQTGNVAANDATLQVENNGDVGIVSEGGDVIINFVPGTHLPTYLGKQSIIKGNGKSGIIANGRGKLKEDTDDEYYGNVRASHIVVEGNGVKINKDGIALKPSLKNAGHGIYASNYVELTEPRVVDNKGYGIVSKYDVVIYGSETATNEFNNNGGAGIYSQSGDVVARDAIISVEENGRFGIGADKGGAFLNDATVINNKGIGIVVGGDLSINKGKVCDNKGGDIKVKGLESIGEEVVICDKENQ